MDKPIIEALLRLIEVKDASTAAHTWRVTLYTHALADAAKLEAERVQRLTVAASLHDIGKLDIPEEILQKPGKLDDREFQIMKGHTTAGHERLLAMGEDDQIMLDLVRHHHERWDGLGYPDSLAGEQIPLAARYFSVIDTFDALTSVRPYRNDIGEDAAKRAIEELQRCKGTRYFPDAVDMFTKLFETGSLDWIMHYYNDWVPVPQFNGPELMKKIERDAHDGGQSERMPG